MEDRVRRFFDADSVLCIRYGLPPGQYILIFDQYDNVVVEGTGIRISKYDFPKVFPEDVELPKEEYGGIFNLASVEKVPLYIEGLYHIHYSDSLQYLGRSSCLRTRLLQHLKCSSNRKLRESLASGLEFVFLCWPSPDPKYEEALKLVHMKNAGYLTNQRREIKPLIPWLDDIYLDP